MLRMDGGGENSECVENEDEGDAEGSGERCVHDMRVVEKLELSRWNG